MEIKSFIEAQKEICEDCVSYVLLDPMIGIAVADGAGGMSGGAEASHFFIERFKKYLWNLKNQKPEDILASFFSEIDQLLWKDSKCGECAGIVILIDKNQIYGASVGDCEAWTVTSSEITKLTQYQIRKPLLGSNQSISTYFKLNKFNGLLIVGTDGLFKYTKPQIIQSIVLNEPIHEATLKLSDSVRLKSGKLQDDIGFIIFRN